MKSTRLRRSLIVALALAAVAAAAPLPTAEARAAGSSFAGTFAWNDGNSWAVAISAKGQITGSLLTSGVYTKGSISGRVNADGTYSFTMSVTFPTMDNPERRTHGPELRTAHYKFAGTLALDADGTIVGTSDGGGSESFVWLRQ